MSAPATTAPYGPTDQVTAAVAAQQFGISIAAITNWVSRGHLAPAGIDDNGHKTYRVLDLAKAEYKTRSKAQSRR
ncbi:MAG: hypothetical protein E6Q97_25265 [Desulfurellales bacterium]|nr:MAG: hypothetical protein E6Q97_25265 [Desulfurellales bacterium]